jgi:DNA-binding MarR family transcriptional regulator
MTQEQDELIARIEAAEARIMALALRDRSAGLFALDLSMQQFKALFLVAIGGELAGHDLADQLGVGLATTSGIVDRLEKRGLVARRVDPDDRRVRRIGLTDEGRALIEDFNENGRGKRRLLFNRLDPTVLATLAEAADFMADTAESEWGDD